MRFPLVLMYHIVLPPPANADPVEQTLFLHPARFAAQMEDLYHRGYRTLTATEFREAVKRGDPSPNRVLLTFDDAYAHVNASVTPTLARLGFSAVMFAPWGHLAGRNVWDAGHPNLARLEIASADDLKAMDGHGWEIASHGMRHIDLRRLHPAARLTELRASRDGLSNLVGRPVVDFAYPYGASDASVQKDVAEAGYMTGFLALPTPSDTMWQIPRQPIRGDEGMALFRFRTSSASRVGYRLSGLAPRWAKTATRAILH